MNHFQSKVYYRHCELSFLKAVLHLDDQVPVVKIEPCPDVFDILGLDRKGKSLAGIFKREEPIPINNSES